MTEQLLAGQCRARVMAVTESTAACRLFAGSDERLSNTCLAVE